MTENGTENAPHLDALLPQEMARRAEEIGARKVAMDAPGTLALAVLAGAFIALGGVFATTALAGAGTAPWGAMRVLAGVTFSLGLILVIVGGAELFTGNALIVMAWASRRVTTRALLRNWLIVLGGNFLGAAATAGMVFLGGVHHFGGGAVGITALANRPRQARSSASDRRWRWGSCAMPSSASRSGSAIAPGPPPTGSWPSSRRSARSSPPGSSTRLRTCTSSRWACSSRGSTRASSRRTISAATRRP